MKEQKKKTKLEKRVNVTLPLEMYEQFKTLAKEENRNLTNFATVIVLRHVREAMKARGVGA